MGELADLLLLLAQREVERQEATSATAFVRTGSPRWLTALISSLPSPAGSAVNVTVSPGTTMPANRTDIRRRLAGPPAASAATVAAIPIWSIPWAIRLGRPTERANSSSRWIGL